MFANRLLLSGLLGLSTLSIGTLGWAGTRTENDLRSQPAYGYRIGHTESTEEHLKGIIQYLQNRVRDVPTENDADYLMMGDTFHWLGHISEDRNDLREANHWHKLSLDAYRQTKLRKSQRIGGGRLDCLKHAELHLAMLEAGSSLTNLHNSAEHRTEQLGRLMIDYLKGGMVRFGKDENSPDFPIAMSCRNMLENFALLERIFSERFNLTDP